MTTLNQFFPSGGGGGGSSPTLISAEIVVVGGGAWGCSGSNTGNKCFSVPGPPPFSCSWNIAGAAGAAIHARNYMLSRGTTCSIVVGCGAPTANPSSWSCSSFSPICSVSQTANGVTGAGGTSYFGGTSVLCAEGSCTEGIPLKPVAPYAPPTYGTICARRGCTNVSDAQLYDLSIKTGVIHTDILGPTICIFGADGAGYFFSSPLGCTGGNITITPSEMVCINQGGAGSGGGATVFTDLQTWHPGYPDANMPTCRVAKDGTVIIKYPNIFPASPSFPGAFDCSPQTPGYYTYRFVSPGSITLP